MGRETEKSKQRKIKRKQGKQYELLVRVANSCDDPLSQLPSFKRFTKGDLTADLEIVRARDVKPNVMDRLMELTRLNMMEAYNKCSWGWDDESKLAELTHHDAYHLLAKSGDDILAFAHFRFDMDYGEPVVYIYELQLDAKVQRKGLGRFMNQTLEVIGFKQNMNKVVLTVLKHNDGALEFYRKMGYTLDITNPDEIFDDPACYFILSKKNKNSPNHQEKNTLVQASLRSQSQNSKQDATKESPTDVLDSKIEELNKNTCVTTAVNESQFLSTSDSNILIAKHEEIFESTIQVLPNETVLPPNDTSTPSTVEINAKGENNLESLKIEKEGECGSSSIMPEENISDHLEQMSETVITEETEKGRAGQLHEESTIKKEVTKSHTEESKETGKIYADKLEVECIYKNEDETINLVLEENILEVHKEDTEEDKFISKESIKNMLPAEKEVTEISVEAEQTENIEFSQICTGELPEESLNIDKSEDKTINLVLEENILEVRKEETAEDKFISEESVKSLPSIKKEITEISVEAEKTEYLECSQISTGKLPEESILEVRKEVKVEGKFVSEESIKNKLTSIEKDVTKAEAEESKVTNEICSDKLSKESHDIDKNEDETILVIEKNILEDTAENNFDSEILIKNELPSIEIEATKLPVEAENAEDIESGQINPCELLLESNEETNLVLEENVLEVRKENTAEDKFLLQESMNNELLSVEKDATKSQPEESKESEEICHDKLPEKSLDIDKNGDETNLVFKENILEDKAEKKICDDTLLNESHNKEKNEYETINLVLEQDGASEVIKPKDIVEKNADSFDVNCRPAALKEQKSYYVNKKSYVNQPRKDKMAEEIENKNYGVRDDDAKSEKSDSTYEDVKDPQDPQYIPKGIFYYEHDNRNAESTPPRPRKFWKNDEDTWLHDKYCDNDQSRKTEQEIIEEYGYDIRSEPVAPAGKIQKKYKERNNKNYEKAFKIPDKPSVKESNEKNKEPEHVLQPAKENVISTIENKFHVDAKATSESKVAFLRAKLKENTARIEVTGKMAELNPFNRQFFEEAFPNLIKEKKSPKTTPQKAKQSLDKTSTESFPKLNSGDLLFHRTKGDKTKELNSEEKEYVEKCLAKIKPVNSVDEKIEFLKQRLHQNSKRYTTQTNRSLPLPSKTVNVPEPLNKNEVAAKTFSMPVPPEFLPRITEAQEQTFPHDQQLAVKSQNMKLNQAQKTFDLTPVPPDFFPRVIEAEGQTFPHDQQLAVKSQNMKLNKAQKTFSMPVPPEFLPRITEAQEQTFPHDQQLAVKSQNMKLNQAQKTFDFMPVPPDFFPRVIEAEEQTFPHDQQLAVKSQNMRLDQAQKTFSMPVPPEFLPRITEAQEQTFPHDQQLAVKSQNMKLNQAQKNFDFMPVPPDFFPRVIEAEEQAFPHDQQLAVKSQNMKINQAQKTFDFMPVPPDFFPRVIEAEEQTFPHDQQLAVKSQNMRLDQAQKTFDSMPVPPDFFPRITETQEQTFPHDQRFGVMSQNMRLSQAQKTFSMPVPPEFFPRITETQEQTFPHGQQFVVRSKNLRLNQTQKTSNLMPGAPEFFPQITDRQEQTFPHSQQFVAMSQNMSLNQAQKTFDSISVPPEFYPRIKEKQDQTFPHGQSNVCVIESYKRQVEYSVGRPYAQDSSNQTIEPPRQSYFRFPHSSFESLIPQLIRQPPPQLPQAPISMVPETSNYCNPMNKTQVLNATRQFSQPSGYN